MPQNYPENQQFNNEPGPVFRIGAPGYSGEIIGNGGRWFFWSPSAIDEQFSHIAGWSGLALPPEAEQELNEQNQLIIPAKWLKLPISTSSASSVLSGMEAWRGQKQEIVQFLVGYTQSLHAQHGVTDISLNLDTIGVSRGNQQIFAVPPHYAETDHGIVDAWLTGLSQDLEQVLSAEPNRDELMQDFHSGMSFLGGSNDA